MELEYKYIFSCHLPPAGICETEEKRKNDDTFYDIIMFYKTYIYVIGVANERYMINTYYCMYNLATAKAG